MANSCCPKCGDTLVRTETMKSEGNPNYVTKHFRWWKCPTEMFDHGQWKEESRPARKK